ncbi:MAG TPA: tRNA (guanosine(46)-N7)-methyltransferase TrmB, partial [Burkholderiales bacterium]|nr:tRNA (guanosine(46)-N7)-methyltransferase TrmB [Burkholderiales bacterium]
MSAVRPIRSFVLRQGRMTEAQRRSYDTLLPLWGIPYRPQPLDLEQAFGRAAPRVLEIGFGMGEGTAAIAAAHPENDYLAVEVHTPGVGSLLRRIAEAGISNVRVIQHDAVEVLTHMLTPASLDAVHLYFPDPWPKKRHHKRRLVQREFAALVASRLRPGGILHVATDW